MKPVQHLRIPTAKATETIRAGGRTATFTERLARSSATHPWRTMGIWLAIIVVAVLSASSLLGSGLTSTTKQHGRQPDSTIGLELIQDRMTGPQKMSEFVIVRSATLTAKDAAYKAYVSGLAGEIAGLGDGVVEGVVTSYQTKDPTMVSKDGHAMLVQVVLAGDLNTAIDHVDELHAVVTARQGGGFTLQQTGTASLSKMGNELARSDMERAEIFGLPAALVVLVLVFGALLAAFMPLVLSIISIILALALTGLIGQLYPMNTFVLNILTTMGLAVGIDYTLFIISRYREERARGLAKIDAIAATGASANRAIFFSGMTVVLAMLGMVIVPMDLTISMGIGAMLVVFTTLLTSLILLPALMGLLGDRVNALRVPLVSRFASRRANGAEGVWERLSHSIMRRPVIWLAAAVTLLLLAASPIVFMKTGSTAATAAGYPDDQYAKQGWDTLGREFSLGTANPVQIVVDGQADTAAVQDGVARLQTALAADGRFGPAQFTVNRAGDLTVVSAPLAGDPAAEATQRVIRHLRESVVPAAFGASAAHVYVAGTTAGVVDYLGFFDRWLPIALAVVLSLSFVLLLLAFRSLVIAAKAILMNLLSVGAAYGLLVLVFQKGVGAHLFGFQQVASIEAWVPLFLFSLLFGLSMDYQVFLLTRIKERFDQTGDTREAVAHGIGRTAGIITGAAAIMVCVFGGMATGELVMFQQMGFGLAVAIFLDATVVRTIIVPAGMELLGDWNWYLPRWLQWLPDISVEGRRPAAGESEGLSRDGRDSGRLEGVPAPPVVPAPQTERVPTFRVPAHAGAPAAR
jgi:RND superfamily putative drug exporter